jgi:hypothetical protein
MPIRALRIGLAMLVLSANARAQTPVSGDVTTSADFLPNRSRAAELRARLFAESTLDPTPALRLTLSGFAEGLLARRPAPTSDEAERSTVRDAVFRVQDASLQYTSARFELLAGYTDVVWGRLDELQPTDVVNPLDASRFFFEGRREARLPVGLLRARAFVSDDMSIEGVYVPFFRRGRLDQLDEPSSPFNLPSTSVASALKRKLPAADGVQLLPIAIEQHEPPATIGNAQGGARFNATTGRVDWSVSAYRGFEPFGLAAFGPVLPTAAVLPVRVTYPRFTMIGGDFETVRGGWGVRGEIAFVDDSFQDPSPRVVAGSSLDAGAGADRKAGAYWVSGTVLFHRESYDQPIDGELDRADVSLIMSADRTFSRERYRVRTFGVYNATEGSAFLRGIGMAKVRDNVALEGSVGWFAGRGRSLIGRFSDCDFGYVRLKYYF